MDEEAIHWEIKEDWILIKKVWPQRDARISNSPPLCVSHSPCFYD